ncbi:S-methyl-5-thioribose-1-phosphate isomerase [Cognatiyoonia sp.]|uniref:S-methyl-5-thioribose-1-phosphate isomerase n=1 Tax=Cognatiyoonia sp. TaxID=2211652 RepID=UPI003F699375
MKVDGVHYRSLWWNEAEAALEIIDQRWLPHEFVTQQLGSLHDYASAIYELRVRGAPLIGATAAYGVAFAMQHDPTDRSFEDAYSVLYATRPTAINLKWALDRARAVVMQLPETKRFAAALQFAHDLADADVETNRMIGVHGLEIIKEIAAKKPAGEPVNLLTHCNAGWIATVDWGTATSPMYHAHNAGIPIHTWVDETRPRNQGSLTSWELGSHGIPHTYIVDNAGGHLMQHGQVDMVIVGTDRTTRAGDVCNKIGTYLKALAATANGVPFYVALPSSTIDWTARDGRKEIPIEERDGREISHIFWGKNAAGEVTEVQITPDGAQVANPAFDVTPADLVTGLITERGVCEPTEAALAAMFPDLAGA